MTVVANNLPGYMQYLDLIRDCIELFSLEPMPPNEVETEHEFNSDVNVSYSYAGEDNRHHRLHGASEKFELTEYNSWLEQGRKRRSKKKKKRELESQNSGSVLEGTQSQTESPDSSEANSSSQLHPEQNTNEEVSRQGDSPQGSEE